MRDQRIYLSMCTTMLTLRYTPPIYLIQKTIFNLLTVLCRFMLVPDAVLTGNDAVPTTTPAPTFGIPPTPGKRSKMSWTDVHGKVYSSKLSLLYVCICWGVGYSGECETRV